MNLFGEGVHNFIDGLIIAASYIASIPIGIATTIAVIFHEGPHELGNFSILVYAGIKKERALLYNFLISMTAILGAVIGLLISSQSESILNFLIPFAAGNFIYIAGSDLIPEIHKDSEKISKAILQLIMFLLGIGIMYVLLILG
jgi:zinc and cadmium transporter